jgi:hypothetical protein
MKATSRPKVTLKGIHDRSLNIDHWSLSQNQQPDLQQAFFVVQ